MQRRSGARVIEWRIGCSNDVGVNIQVGRRKCLCDVGVHVAMMNECMFDFCRREFSSDVLGHHRYMVVGGAVE